MERQGHRKHMENQFEKVTNCVHPLYGNLGKGKPMEKAGINGIRDFVMGGCRCKQ